ncbi:MAG: hypothetical protein AAFR97_16330, partial [Bacteroidota bacterium]
MSLNPYLHTLYGQLIPVPPSSFYEVLPPAYGEIIIATEDKPENILTEKRIDSTRKVFDEMLANEALEDRMRVCVLAAYGQLLIQAKYFSEAFSFSKQANDLATQTLPVDDLIRGYAQAAYGSYLDFYHARELALAPLLESLYSLEKFSTTETELGRAV